MTDLFKLGKDLMSSESLTVL